MKTSEEYLATDPIVRMSADELGFLDRATRKCARICAHKPTDRLLEMFAIYHRETYVRPHRHFGKDESVFVIRGEAEFVFFDEAGKLTEVVRMGEVASGKAYYCRVPATVFHTMRIRSDSIILFEAAPGPFDPADTAYADWAPAESEHDAIAAYVGELHRRIAVA